MSGIGHNSGDAQVEVLNGTAQKQLKTIIERFERLDEDKVAIQTDQKEVLNEAKGNGFDVKIIRKIIRIRKMDPGKLAEEEAITDLYLSAIGDASVPAFEPEAEQEDEDHDDIG